MSRHVSSIIDSTLEVEAYVIIAFANFKLKLFLMFQWSMNPTQKITYLHDENWALI